MAKFETEHYLKNLILRYCTGWLQNQLGGGANGDWTNVHLGNDPNNDSNVEHNLDSSCMGELIVKLYISSDGTPANAFEVNGIEINGLQIFGYTTFYIDSNTIKLQTGKSGITYLDDNGDRNTLTNEAYYYKIVVYKINCRNFFP